MVRASGKDRGGSVELFEEHHACKHVGPDHRSEGQHGVSLFAEFPQETVCASDKESRVRPAGVAESLQPVGEFGRGHFPAAFVQSDDCGAIWDRFPKNVSLGCGACTSPWLHLMFKEGAHAQGTGGTVETCPVVGYQGAFGGVRTDAANRSHVEPHHARAALPGCAPAGSHIFSNW